MAQQPLVLFVDDEEDLCTLMQMMLSRMGIETHVAYRIAQAKKMLSEHHYDVCFTDLNLPDGSGLELVEEISQQYPQLPVAVLTAYGNMDIAIAALKAGAFDFVSKPIKQTHLEQLLQKALNNPVQPQASSEDALEQRMLIGQSAPIEQLRVTLKRSLAHKLPCLLQVNLVQAKKLLQTWYIASVIATKALLLPLTVVRFLLTYSKASCLDTKKAALQVQLKTNKV